MDSVLAATGRRADSGEKRIFAAMIREMLDLAMPRECLVCGRRLGTQERHLCIWCASDLPYTAYWERAHNAMADQFNALLEQLRPEGEPMTYAYATALLFYHHENPYKRIPQALKYGSNLQAGRFFSARLGAFMARMPQWADVDTVIPVPLHAWRKWQRGYNQAEVIAAELARALHATLRADALQRTRRTRSQTRLDAQARLRNVSGVFRLRRRFPARHVLLVDDTFTTGATLSACYYAVRKALGPSVRISIATLAVVEA